jgi:hypothetical protein
MTDAEFEKLSDQVASYLRRGRRIPRKLLERFACCRDCESKDYEPLPMIVSDVWLKAVPGGHGSLCQACFEKRLGRPFVREDCADPSDWNEEDFNELYHHDR